MKKSRNFEIALKRRLLIGALCVAFGIFVLPMILYIYKFGIVVSDDHERWAEFGDAMSGIYAPILGVLTLLLLIRQIVLQNTLANHQQAQDFVTGNRVDLEFALLRLETYLSRKMGEEKVAFFFKNAMRAFSFEDLISPEKLKFIKIIDDTCPELFATWGSVYAILAGLKHNSDPMYNLAFQSAVLKSHSFLSYEICVCLDHYHFLTYDGDLNFEYQFSSILEEAREANGLLS